MTTFFEKLKKGMIDVEEKPIETPVEAPEVEKVKEVEEKKKPERRKAGRKRVKKEKVVERKKEEFKKIEVEEEPASAPLASGASAGKEEKKWPKPEGQLAVDIYETDKEIVIQAAIAGVNPEDLDISTENDMLLIRGVREKPSEEEKEEKKNYFYQECYWGPFSREVVLPEEVDLSRIQASIKQGILTIRIPKIERRANKKITIGA